MPVTATGHLGDPAIHNHPEKHFRFHTNEYTSFLLHHLSHSIFLHFKDPLQVWFLDQVKTIFSSIHYPGHSVHMKMFLLCNDFMHVEFALSAFSEQESYSTCQPFSQNYKLVQISRDIFWVDISLLNQYIFAYLMPNIHYTSAFNILSLVKKIYSSANINSWLQREKNSGEVNCKF